MAAANGAMPVQVDLRVGILDVSLARLLTKGHHIIEFPTLLLPEDVKPGSIVRLTCERDVAKEARDHDTFEAVQDSILAKFAGNSPKKPVMWAKNVTQTSVVLGWDPIDVATADLRSLALFKGEERIGIIPNPFKRTSTKLSSLEIDQKYEFRLVLSTSAGEYSSERVPVHTHKMTDLTGITACVGSLTKSNFGVEELSEILERMGANPLQDKVKLDTTHFICTTEEGQQYQRAKDLNIPIVRPEWLKACETERKLVSVGTYYISADPTLIPESSRHSRSETIATNASVKSLNISGDASIDATADKVDEEVVAAVENKPLPASSEPAEPVEPLEPESEPIETAAPEGVVTDAATETETVPDTVPETVEPKTEKDIQEVHEEVSEKALKEEKQEEKQDLESDLSEQTQALKLDDSEKQSETAEISAPTEPTEVEGTTETTEAAEEPKELEKEEITEPKELEKEEVTELKGPEEKVITEPKEPEEEKLESSANDTTEEQKAKDKTPEAVEAQAEEETPKKKKKNQKKKAKKN